MKTTTTHTPSSKKGKKNISWRALTPWFIIAGVIIAVLGTAAIYTAITQGNHRKVYQFEYNKSDGSYYDKKQDITYQPIPFCYEAVLNGAEAYPYAESELHKLYQVGYRDDENKVHLKKATDWLSTAKSVGGQVYYNPKTVKFPAFADFDWDVIYFSNPDSSQFSTYTLRAEDTDRLMKEFLDEDAKNYFQELYYSGTLDIKLTLKVSSKTFKWLYLNLNLVADEEGNYYLYPQGTAGTEEPRLVSVDESYFEDYLKTLEEIIEGTPQ